MKKIHNGNLTAEPGKVYEFEEITGSLDVSGADTTFPKLTTIGGHLNASGADTKASFPKLKTKSDYAAYKRKMAQLGFDLSDPSRIMSKIIKRHGDALEVRIVGRSKNSWIVRKNGKTAHGKTLTEAKTNLAFKLNRQNTSRFLLLAIRWVSLSLKINYR